VMNTLSETTRRSPERYGKALPHLTKTYHGCRLLGNFLRTGRGPHSRPLVFGVAFDIQEPPKLLLFRTEILNIQKILLAPTRDFISNQIIA
jgi:hypothetical protein